MRLNLLFLALLSVVICSVQASQSDPAGFSPNYDSTDQEEYETEAQTPVEYRAVYNNFQDAEEADYATYRRGQNTRKTETKKQAAKEALETQAQTNVEYRAKLYSNFQDAEEADYATYRRDQDAKKPDGKRLPTNQELEEEEEQKPDRLALLLEQSKFACEGKVTGYYADESLNCEVFHYCQDNSRHSWICPEGFTFHQVHLICMPPAGENICDQSSKYHIVNDYLYKPINTAEHESKPNVTLRYSDRYFPDSFFQDTRQDYDDVPQQASYHKTPIQVGFTQQRRAPVPTAAPQGNQGQYQFSTPQPQVYRSPDDINISLQQRRPQPYFASPTQKYPETDYGYEQ